jgi:hypothetical protein
VETALPILSLVVSLVSAGIAAYVHGRSSELDRQFQAQQEQAQQRYEQEREESRRRYDEERQEYQRRYAEEREAVSKAEASQKILARYREPLAQSAFDLQSRIYNILELNFIETFLVRGDPLEQTYAVENTTFLIAQYFAFAEIIRREIFQINLEDEAETRKLAELQSGITSKFRSDGFGFSKAFRLFAGEQRAIGERLLVAEPDRLGCIGYARFLDWRQTSTDPLVEKLRADVLSLRDGLDPARDRLVAIQAALVDLLDFLDSKHVRFPSHLRTKLSDL